MLSTRTFPAKPHYSRIRAAKPSHASIAAVKYRHRIGARERELLHREVIRFASGIGVIIVTISTAFGLLLLAAAFREGHGAHVTWESRTLMAAVLIGAFFLLSIPVALLTRRESRSDVADGILEHGIHAGANDHPLSRFVAHLAFIGLLHGEFMVIDAMKALWLRVKLRSVDRERAAVILVTLVSRPEGMGPGELFRHGESPKHLRKTLAYLIACEWVDLSRDGRHITLLSPAKRALKN